VKTFTFGLIADPQYGEIPSRGSRFYSNSLEKIRRCTEIFQNESVSFAVCLGDMVEGSPNAAKECEDATAALLYGGFPCHFVIGNHDVHAVSRSFLTRLWNYPDDRGYYAFSFGGVLFLVLDTNYNEEGLPSGIDSEGGPCEWTKTYVSEEQLEWIEKTLMKRRKSQEGHRPTKRKNHLNKKEPINRLKRKRQNGYIFIIPDI
jgi:3',5'-cyclic AMP phosphodiesterase CpdA